MYKVCPVPVLNLSLFSVWPARNRHTITRQLLDSFVAAYDVDPYGSKTGNYVNSHKVKNKLQMV